MSLNHQQDLTFFKDNSIVSDKILYGTKSYLTVVSYVEGTQPTWLVNSLIENSLSGTGTLVNKDLTSAQPKRSDVFYVSFTNNADYYIKGCRKNGIDLSKDSNFHFIDCFTDLFTRRITTPETSESQVKKMFTDIFTQIEKVGSERKVVFIENPEFLLQATDITAISFSNLLVKLNRLCKNLVVTSCQSPQFVDTSVNDINDASHKITDLMTKLHQRTNLNVHVEPLTTGRAKDITGILSISKGPIPFDGLVVDEKSYTFNLSKESNIKLYFR